MNFKKFTTCWGKWWIGVLLSGLLIGLLGLYLVSDGHIKDYLVWRWMVTFKRPVASVTDYRILISKSEHQLSVFHKNEPVKSFRIALSKHGADPRRIWADELTPEGSYLIASMQYKSQFGPRQMLLETTKQSLDDYYLQYGEAGGQRIAAWELQHGLLDTIWEVYDFNQGNSEFPIWNDILIHGGGSDTDWTWGCIALDDRDVVELFDILKQSTEGGLGVEVEIRH
ncbi:MAG TPA: L,D-transpeptidase [Anaerolineales bacterium]|nr:L,D-transpeptidase [Anaerolineales bacterium]